MLDRFTRRPPATKTPAKHLRPFRRKTRLVLARARRDRHRFVWRLMLFSGWVWIAAVSFVGIEMFEVIFGTFVLAPEILPLVLIGLACAWFFRDRLRRLWARVRTRPHGDVARRGTGGPRRPARRSTRRRL
jgi:hypothetical protein